MKLRQGYSNVIWEEVCTEDLIHKFVPFDDPREVAGLIARLIDAMPLTDQQKLDIIAPYTSWKVMEEEE